MCSDADQTSSSFGILGHHYPQQQFGGGVRASPRGLAAMRIHRLPEELAPIVHRHANPQNLSSSLGNMETLKGVHVTGVRMPVPNASRYFSIQRNTSEPVGIDIEVNRPCELMICFHDPAAITRGGSVTHNTRISYEGLNLDERQVSSTELKMPFWGEKMGLKRTNMKVSERDRVGRRAGSEEGCSPTSHSAPSYMGE